MNDIKGEDVPAKLRQLADQIEIGAVRVQAIEEQRSAVAPGVSTGHLRVDLLWVPMAQTTTE